MNRSRWVMIVVAVAVAAGIAFLLFDTKQSVVDDENEEMILTQDAIKPGQNRLALEKSPYLLQHADNPVDWYPWGEEAFQKAREQDKPIFLSIGYSTCHWCHVMEHESFEDSTIASLMNDAFINIKVDREERPDIDNIYMTFCQLMTGSGGWPLTIVMTPEQKPFFAATYIPKENRYGRVGMAGLIPQIKNAWVNRREEVDNASKQLTLQMQTHSTSKPGESELSGEFLALANQQLTQRFDAAYGGFGSAPKFPTPHTLLFLLRYWKRSGNEQTLDMVEKTLSAMADGGIYDHVGFGFHRYSTDAKWFAPHFEKMLYDQAMLLMAYTEGYQATGKEKYRRTAEQIITYVERDMTDPRGGFYSAEDADSEGKEGKFYLWSDQELRDLLGAEEGGFAIDLFGVEVEGNFAEEVPLGNILHLRRPLASVADEMGIDEKALRGRIEAIRQKLYDAREQRIHPIKDDKILADWNGLMIAAIAKAGRAFDNSKYTELASRAAAFVLDEMRDKNGRLLHRYRDGEVGIQANLDDYTFFMWGLLELYENTFDVAFLKTALDLNEILIDRFWDPTDGAFFFTPDDGEQLIVRTKEIYDGAVPSGNSVAMLNLIRLSRLTADPALEDRATQIGRVFYDGVSQAPATSTVLLMALDFGVGPSYEVVIVGDPSGADTAEMVRTLRSTYEPSKVVVFKATGDVGAEISSLATYTASQTAIDGKATAYVCRNYACELPTTDSKKMLELLASGL